MVKQGFTFPVWAAPLFIALAVLLPYSNTFNASFHFDDESAIIANAVTQKGSPAQIVRAYPHRFIGYWTFALNYRLHGLSVTGYHIVNIIIHLLASLLVFALVTMLMKTPSLRRNAGRPSETPLQAPGTGWVPLFAALIFAVHPVQTQAVTYIVQRLASLTALWYLLAMTAYVRGRLAATDDKKHAWPWMILSFAAGLLSMFTKENAATLPVALVMIEGFFFCVKISDLR